MRKTLSLLTLAILAFSLVGCANAQKKLGRGLNNTVEIVRMGEFRRSMEQTALFDGPEKGYSGGLVTGLTRTFSRTGIGIFEVLTFPIPPYDPVTDHYAGSPPYPDNYTPGLVSDAMFATDTNLGFSGGDVLPVVPGSRFRIFDTH